MVWEHGVDIREDHTHQGKIHDQILRGDVAADVALGMHEGEHTVASMKDLRATKWPDPIMG